METKEEIHFENRLYANELFTNIDDALIATDTHFVITHWNKAAERIYGITAKEAIGNNRENITKYEHISSSLVSIYYDLKTIGKWKGLLKFTRKDGVDIYLQSSSSAVKNDVDQVIGYVAVNRDITSQYMAEQSLEHFTAIMHSLDASFLIVNRDMKVVFLSPRKRIKEFQNSNYKIGDDAFKYIPDRHLKEVAINYTKAFTGETICHETDSGGDEANRVYQEITYLPITNSYNYVTHVAIIAKDLTDEKRLAVIEKKQREMEKQLFHSRVLFENFMQNSPMPAWVTDEDGMMRYMNLTYLKATSFTQKDIGKSIYDLFTKEDADLYKANNAEVLKSNRAIEVQEQVLGSDHKVRTYCNIKFPMHFHGKMMVAGWALDITTRNNIQTELEEANNFKTKLLSVISHDLRSPLTSTTALTSLVEENGDSFTKEELLEFMGLIKKGNKKTLSLLDELRVWAQTKTNKVSYEPKVVNVSDLIYSSVDFLQNSLTEKETQVTYDLQPGITAMADADMVKTIVRNLVSNAIKFSPFSSTITICSHVADNEVMISVSNEGEGIEEEIQKRILEGTNSISTYGTNGEKGIGLGLTICKEFIDLNKGRLAIQNLETKGCIFSFTLPTSLVPSTM